MKIQPSRTKYRYQQKNLHSLFVPKVMHMFPKSYYALRVDDCKLVSYNCLNSIELSVKRSLRNISDIGRSILIRIFPDKPYTKKPNTSGRMGKGKTGSDIVYYVAKVRKGTILLEITRKINEVKALKALKTAKSKLGLSCTALVRDENNIREIIL